MILLHYNYVHVFFPLFLGIHIFRNINLYVYIGHILSARILLFEYLMGIEATAFAQFHLAFAFCFASRKAK